MDDQIVGNIYLAWDFVDKVFKLTLSEIPVDTDGNYKLSPATMLALADMAQRMVRQGKENGYVGFENIDI